MEEWRDITGYEGSYQISNLGQVKSLNRTDTTGRSVKEKILKGTLNKDGYLCVDFKKDGKRKSFRVHRLVAEAFIPNFENKPCVDHINTIRDDNRVENLRWVTHKENVNNVISKERYSEARKGEKNPMYGVHRYGEKSPNLGSLVARYDLNMDLIDVKYQFEFVEMGFNAGNISACCRGRQKTHKGYIFKYISDCTDEQLKEYYESLE